MPAAHRLRDRPAPSQRVGQQWITRLDQVSQSRKEPVEPAVKKMLQQRPLNGRSHYADMRHAMIFHCHTAPGRHKPLPSFQSDKVPPETLIDFTRWLASYSTSI